MRRRGDEFIVLGVLLLLLAALALLEAPGAFEWHFVIVGAVAVCVGLLEREKVVKP